MKNKVMKKGTKKSVEPKAENKALNYVEVVDTKLDTTEKIDTLVRIPFIQLISLGMESFMQHISILAIGREETPGQFKLNNIEIQLAGTVSEDLIFNVRGVLEKYNVETKRLPKITKVKKKK